MMISRSGLLAAIVGYLLFPPSTLIVTSFSTVLKHVRNQCNGFAAKDESFGAVQQRSYGQVSSSVKFPGTCFRNSNNEKAKKFQKMVVNSNSINVIDWKDDTKESEKQGEELKLSVSKRLSDWFQGDFDNYAQVVEDRRQNLQPREGGGHEHFHCTLIPVTESTRLAAFFFDGNPDRIFRFRYYEMIPPSTEDGDVEMMLNALHPELEKLLKSEASNPLSWPSIFENFQPTNKREPKVNRLTNCEISWSFQIDPVQHSYLTDTPENEEKDKVKSLHAVMVHGPTIVNSTMVPGMQIRIVDQLSLYQDVFYINDRGFDPTSGSFIYGNQREVPYRLERVSSISSLEEEGLAREITNSDLEWTIGPEFRSVEDYELKLESIGGPSVGMKKKSFKNSDVSKQ
mmetsp:Transcript_21321/g.43868  ORF Transcript_21321/g.43868 Transcript_21321/m.43868 type:complete len:399 (-) Transcript_21321:1169-2365(-)